MQDEYITMKNITAPAHTYNHNHTQNHHDEVDSGPSKFDRYKYQDEDDEMDEGNLKFFLIFFSKNFICVRFCFRWFFQDDAKVGTICAQDNAAKEEVSPSAVGWSQQW